MNNPGMDFEIWKGLRRKWTGLDARGHKVKVDFQLIAHPSQKEHVLAIDVVQHIDGKPVTETVQRQAGEGYAPLGIAGLTMDRLVEVYKEMLGRLREGSRLENIDVVVSMAPTSETSGEVSGLLVMPDAPVQSPVQVNYQHYYVLNALRERMGEMLGERWKQVRATYHEGNVEFYFEY
jgi:hypothetical protein